MKPPWPHPRAVLEAVRAHPRHVVLFGVVAGLLAGPRSPAALFACAVAAAVVAGSPGVAIAAAVAVLGGAVVADARLAAIDGGRLPALARAERAVAGRAVLLEPFRTRRDAGVAARARLIGGSAPGEVAVLRIPAPRVPRRLPGTGEIVAVRGRLRPLARFEEHQRRRGALAALEVAALLHTGARRGGLSGALDSIRRRAERGLEVALPPPEAALVRGMVLGQDEALSDGVREDFQRSGLAHLLAVSGQNVMLLATLVLFGAGLAGLELRARLLLALGLVAMYVPLAGAGPSIQRAGVMGAAGLVAAMAGRPASRWYALGLAAAATLALNPRAVEEAGWQLSFAAVAGLLALVPGWRRRLTARGVPAPVADAASLTVAATVATAPLLAFHFEYVSLSSLPANLLAAPAVAPVMWLGMVAAALAQVAPALAGPVNALNAPLLAYLEWVAHAAAGVPGAAVGARLGGPAALAAAYAALAGLGWAGWAGWRRAAVASVRVRLAIAVAAAGVTIVGGLAVALRPGDAPLRVPGELVVSFLDVGQGDATLIQRDRTAVLVDTGPERGPVLRRLTEAGVDRLDVLLITHAQDDHEGAALGVLRAHRPRVVVNGGAGWPTDVQRALPAAAARVGAQMVEVAAGEVLRLGALRFRLLWPPPPGPGFRPDGDPNDRAVVAHLTLGDFDLLLPADAESNVTAALALPRVEALKVAHHGSADEGLQLLLERLQPKIAAIEVGRRNSYGHPAPSTLDALRVVPSVVRTDQDGTVRLRVRNGEMRLERSGPRE